MPDSSQQPPGGETSPSDAEQWSTQPTNIRWIVFVLCCGTSWTMYLHRYIFGLIKPQVQEEFNLSNTELGGLDSINALCYSLFQFPSGVLADVMGIHIYLGGAILLWSIGLGMHAWAGNVTVLGYARGVLGIGQAGAFAAVSRTSKIWFPAGVRSSVQGWMGVASARIGAVSSNLLVASLLIGTLHLDWRTTVNIFTVEGLLLGVVFLLVVRNSPRKHPLVNKAEADLIEGTSTPMVRKKMAFREMFGRMSPRSLTNLGAVNLASTLSTMADNIYSSWIPLFLATEHGLKFKEMGFYSALPLLGGACGGAVGGWLNDRFIRTTGNRRWTRSLIGFGGKGMAGVMLAVAIVFYDDPYMFCAMLFVVKFFADTSLATRWGVVTDIGGRATATVFAFNNSVAGIGAIVAPTVYGMVSDSAALGWKPVFYIAIILYALCAASWLLINCTVPILREDDEE